jgi:alanine-glyoxylate transaminase/serine-glyoxylate transaminase/serine-pyruvate transaminase
MKAYENGTPAYFATPPVNLIYAFYESLTQITKASPSLEDRFKLHREASQRFKRAAAELGLKQLPLDPAYAANGMTAVSSVFLLCLGAETKRTLSCITLTA